MARIEGVKDSEAGLLARLAFFFCKRKVGQVIEPIRIHAHHPRLLRGLGGMEMAQDAARTVSRKLKDLASLQAARGVGCPF